MGFSRNVTDAGGQQSSLWVWNLLAVSGVVFDGVILEGAFNSQRQQIPYDPFTWVQQSSTVVVFLAASVSFLTLFFCFSSITADYQVWKASVTCLRSH